MNDLELKYYIHPKMQEKFREAMGDVRGNDPVYWPKHQSKGLARDFGFLDLTELILLPLPIDPVNPERGLWGMLDWNWFTMEVDGPDVHIFQWDAIEEEYIWTSGHCNVTLALLKALAHQIGAEVEEK